MFAPAFYAAVNDNPVIKDPEKQKCQQDDRDNVDYVHSAADPTKVSAHIKPVPLKAM